MLILKQVLEEIGSTQRELAQHLQISSAGVAQICNHGIYPKKPDEKTIRSGILEYLKQRGASVEVCRRVFDEVQPKQPQEEIMLLPKHTLTQAAKKHFSIFRDPFADDLQSREDVFLTPDMRYVREVLWDKALHGGFAAIVGESGAGKSTLRRDLKSRITDERKNVVLIEPYVQGMEHDDVKGKTLKSAHIAEIIMMAIAPLEKIRRSPQARLDQVRNTLMEGVHAKTSYLLLIEEAHCLPNATLKHLKRFIEMESDDGFKNLLGIVLIGQTELRDKLSGKYREVREVAQRCEVITLMPLNDQLEDYLKFKFQRVGKLLADAVEPSAIEAIRDTLTSTDKSKSGKPGEITSFLYPLVVANLLTASLNLAAEQGWPKVNGDIVKGVKI